MNRKMFVSILTMFFGFVISNVALSPVCAQSFDKTPVAREPSAVRAKQRFDKIVDSGFQVKYEIRGKTMTASGEGNKLTHLRTEKVKLDEQSVVVKAVTKDRALEITTYFSFDEKRQKLLIDRRIRNASKEPVKVQMIGEYFHPGMILGIQGNRKSDLAQAFLKRIRAGKIVHGAPVLEKFTEWLRAGFFEECQCDPPPPPCSTIICPPGPNYIKAEMVASRGNRIELRWQQPTILIPDQALGDAPSPVRQVRSIVEVDIQ